MTLASLTEGAVAFSTHIPFFGTYSDKTNSLSNEKTGRIWDNVIHNSCLPDLMSGITGALVTQHPLPLLVGLGTCIPRVLAQKMVGGEFQVNTNTTGNQYYPTVTSLSNGDFVIAWRDESGNDGNLAGVFGQIFSATGVKIGSEFQVNTYTTGNQGDPSVSSLSNGDFVVTWGDGSGLDGNLAGVFGQIFNAIGAKVNSQFLVNTYTTGNQQYPSVSSLSNGNFVVTWDDGSGLDGSGDGIFGQIFNATGAKVSSQFLVNTYTTGNQQYPSVSSLSNGNFVVSWVDLSGEDGSGFGVFAQIFNATGAKVGNQFLVNTHTTGNQELTSISTLKNGGFTIAWTDESGLDGSGWGVFGQIFNEMGVKVGSQFQVNTYTLGNQGGPITIGYHGGPSISSLNNGNFVVTWQDDSGLDGYGGGVFGQIFDTTGVKIGSEFLVNAYKFGNQQIPCVFSLTNGDFVVAYDDDALDGNGYGVFAQIFSANAVPPTTSSTTAISKTTTSQPTTSKASSAGSTTISSSGRSSSSTTTSPSMASKASSSGGNNTTSLIWPVVGTAGWVTSLAIGGYLLYQQRLKNKRNEAEFTSTSLENDEELGSMMGVDTKKNSKVHAKSKDNDGSVSDSDSDANYGTVAGVNSDANYGTVAGVNSDANDGIVASLNSNKKR